MDSSTTDIGLSEQEIGRYILSRLENMGEKTLREGISSIFDDMVGVT